MKALKEKRVSLRSFLRRGLVILSLLALVFASCSESGGDEGGTNGPQPTAPTAPPAPVVTRLTVITPPQFESYQGLRANLKGMVVEAWIDGVQKYIREGDSEFANFYTGYCDEPWDGYSETSPYTELSLQYLGTTIVAELKIPHIVPADGIEFTQKAPDIMYSDQRPKFEGLEYNMIFKEGWDGWPESRKSTADKKNPTYRPLGTMVATYPKVRYDAATAVRTTYWVYVGKDSYTYKSKVDGKSMVETPYTFEHYYEPYDITFAGADWTKGGSEGKGFFDDDIAAFYGNATAPDVFRIIEQFKKSSVKFNVTYRGDDGARVEKDMSMADFIDNSRWYYDQLNQGGGGGGTYSTFVAGLLKNTDKLRLTPDGNTSILNYGEDKDNDDNENAWRVWLDYAPIAYSQQAGGTAVEVPVQLYVFSDAEVKRLGTNPWVERKGPTFETSVADMSKARDFRDVQANLRGEFDAIADKWALTGSYEGNGKFLNPSKQSRTIPLTKQMFYAGYGVASWLGMGSDQTEINNQLNNSSVKAFPHLILTQVGANASMWNYSVTLKYGNSLDVGDFITAFPLPLYYRQLYEQGEDGVLINLQY